MTTNRIVSGFDMVPTIAWYSANSVMIFDNLPLPRNRAQMEYQLGGSGCLTRQQINACISLFPAPARKRMTLAMVHRLSARWFHRESTNIKPRATEDQSEALSPTAIIPSFVGYDVSEDAWRSNVELYDLPTGIVPDEAVRLIMWTQGCVRECAHTIVTHELYRSNIQLQFPSGVVRQAILFLIEELVPLFNAAPPISHYAGAYFGADGKLPKEAKAFLRAMSENMAEAIAAYLLKFAFRTDGTGLDPFFGRGNLRKAIGVYLRAERVG